VFIKFFIGNASKILERLLFKDQKDNEVLSSFLSVFKPPIIYLEMRITKLKKHI